MKERIVIIFIAVTLGLLVTTIGFFLYETSKPNKDIKPDITKKEKIEPQPNEKTKLTILSPKDEAVSANRTIQVKGITDSQNTVIISSNTEDVVVSPTSEGTFTATITIDAGENKLIVRAIDASGETEEVIQTISFSSDTL
jgi:hypothetical protein